MGEHRSARTRAAVVLSALLGGGGVLLAAGVPTDRVQAPSTPTPTATPSEAVPAPCAPGLTERRLVVEGVQRTFWWQRPPGPPAPLVVGLHGLHGSARAFAAETGLPAATAATGTALALPQSLGPAWNDGRLGPAGPDDQAFLLALLDELVGEGAVDPDRVVVAGYSNGAGLSMALAARHPEVLAGVVAVSGELLDGPGAVHPPAAAPHAVPFWLTHGDADPVQPWAGRPAVAPLLPALVSVERTVEEFRRANRAAERPSVRALAGGTRLSGPVQVRTWAARAPRGAPVTSYRLPGAGHEWPQDGGAGPGDYGFSATDLVLRVVRTVDRAPTARVPAPAFVTQPASRP